MKKLLLIATLLMSSFMFAQQNQIRSNNSYIEKTIKKVSASPNPLIDHTKISFYSSVIVSQSMPCISFMESLPSLITGTIGDTSGKS